jgi:hypothetical protein
MKESAAGGRVCVSSVCHTGWLCYILNAKEFTQNLSLPVTVKFYWHIIINVELLFFQQFVDEART